MTEALLLSMIFACGVFAGFICGTVIVTRRPAREEFDGGFKHDHPRVMTKIWSRDINSEDKP